jgi:hypothetical protein
MGFVECNRASRFQIHHALTDGMGYPTIQRSETMHVNYTDIISEMANDGWGQENGDKKKIKQEIITDPHKLTAYTSLEILRRLNMLGQAFQSPAKSSVPSNDRVTKPHELAAIWPEAKIGDYVYGGELVDGIDKSIIVKKDEKGHCLTISTGEFEEGDWLHCPSYAHTDEYRTLAEAIKEAALSDIKYHGKRLAYAQQALADVESGADLTKYMEEMPDDAQDD